MGLLRSIAQSNPEWRRSIDDLGYSRLLRRQAEKTNVFPVGAGSISLCALLRVRCTCSVSVEVCTCVLANAHCSASAAPNVDPARAHNVDPSRCKMIEQSWKQDAQAIGSGTEQK